MINRNLIKKIIFFTFTIFLCFVFFNIGKEVGRKEPICNLINLEQGQPGPVDFSLFWDVWRVVQDKYVDKSNIKPDMMVNGAIRGMIESLEDPYSSFFTKEESKDLLDNLSGKFEGVGMEIGLKDEILTVVAPLEGTPAQKSGIRAGDKILAIEDESTIGITLEKAVKLIRGQRGTEVKLTIFREDWEQPQEIKIVRAIIEIPSYKLEFKEVGGKNIAHLKLYQFFSKTPVDFVDAVNEILSKNPNGIVLDLRDNPGGYLEVSRDIASWFMEKNQVVVIEDFGQGQEKIHKTRGSSLLKDYPLVVLVNEGSASASEILAGSLRDNRGIKLIGKKTFGKGSVQELETLLNGSSVKITIAKWLTPKRDLIDEKGLDPDFEIEITKEDYESKKDPQLEKAMELIVNGN